MYKSATINARIDQKLKYRAENVLHKIGLSSAEAIRLFYSQVCLHHGLPFNVKIPNTVTQKAIQDADNRHTHRALIIYLMNFNSADNRIY